MTAVPLGTGIRVMGGGDGGDWRKVPTESTWLDLAIGGERTRLPERTLAQIDDYDVYVEHCWARGIPGTYECVSIVTSGSRTGVAAMRAAIRLAHEGPTRTHWDLSQSSGKCRP